MKSGKDCIDSGLLELYVLGQTTPEENLEIELLATIDPSVKKELTEIELALETYASNNSVEPNSTIKPLLLGMIDYSDRIQAGEALSFPPSLQQNSKVDDYEEWLNRTDMVAPSDFNDIYVKILSHTPDITTAIVWIREMAPQEIHDNEFERFLIVEGTCNITIEDEVHQLSAGHYLSIPLYKKHHVTVTSEIPCKVILQRVAA